MIARLLSALLTIFGVSAAVFVLTHVIPGDPVEVMLGEMASPADRQAVAAALGLDQSLWQQFIDYYKHLFQLDLGQSFFSKRDVSELLLERIPATIELAITGLFVALVISFPLGILAAVKKDTPWDRGAMMFSLVGVSIPNFWMGPLLILLFSVALEWLPVSGRTDWSSIVLPALTLGTAMAAILSRMIRASMLEVLSADYIRTARAKGASETRIIWVHALRNAMLPVVTVIGLQLGTALGGAVITETVFAWPGVGLLTIEAIQQRDYVVLQACILLISVTFVSVNALTDGVYMWLDPRVGRT